MKDSVWFRWPKFYSKVFAKSRGLRKEADVAENWFVEVKG